MGENTKDNRPVAQYNCSDNNTNEWWNVSEVQRKLCVPQQACDHVPSAMAKHL